MIDTVLPVREAYFLALQGLEVDFNGEILAVPVYDGAPPEAVRPYILLSTQDTNGDVAIKDEFCYNTEESILLDVVTAFPSGTGGKKLSDLISNEILQRVFPRLTILEKPVYTVFVNSSTLEEEDGAHKIYRRLLRFRNSIFQ